MLVVRRYENQKYTAMFSPRTGFFARIEDQGQPEPLWSEHGPELMDISITNWCDKGCRFCYRKSDRHGHHMSVENYRAVIEQAARMEVLQVAIGGGNPTQHPSFSELLRITRGVGIVPSYTTNGRGLSKEVLAATRDECGAVAVSAYEPWSEFRGAIRKLIDSGIKTNVHYVLDSSSIDLAIEWVSNPPDLLQGVNAVVFLNYKPVSRVPDHRALTRNAGGEKISRFYKLATTSSLPFRVGFDSCMVAGLAWHSDVDPTFFEACEAGRFSMFVSEEMRAYPCSFMVEHWAGVPVTDNNLYEIWSSHPIFAAVRGKLLKKRCQGCGNANSCMGGCPLFAEINLCDPFVSGDRAGDTVERERLHQLSVSAGANRPIA